MRRSYYETKKSIRWFLQSVDAVTDFSVRLLPAQKLPPRADSEPFRVLLLTMGHLGDTLVFSYILPLIQERYPGAIIDVVAGSWCDPIWQHNPHVRRVIHVDHLICNRRPLSLAQKLGIHWQTSYQAIQQLREAVYDISLDIRYADPPSHFLLPFIKARKRIGMGTRRFGGLLDAEFFVPQRGSTFHHVAVSTPLFRALGLTASLETLKPVFYVKETALETLQAKLNASLGDRSAILICPETGMTEKNMPAQFWQRLLLRLMTETDAAVVWSGQKAETADWLNNPDLAPFRHRLVNAVSKLTIDDLATLAKHALLAITLDSFPAHLCPIFCPLIAFYKKNGTGFEFFPIGNQPIVIIHDHAESRNATLPRPHFESMYVQDVDGDETLRLTILKIRQLKALTVQP